MTRSRTEMWQGVAAFVGITLGVIPLVQRLLTGSTGSVWQVVFDPESALGFAAAVVATVVALLVIAALERGKGR